MSNAIMSPKVFLDSLVIEVLEGYKSIWPKGTAIFIRVSVVVGRLKELGYTFSNARVRASMRRVEVLGLLERDSQRSSMNSYCWRVV